MICLHLWLWGVVLLLFDRYRINAPFILEIDPKHMAKPHQVLQVSACTGCLSSCCV